MKFTVSSSELLKQLQVVGGAVGSNSVLPILEDFLFEISNNQLVVTGTNNETTISNVVEIISEGSGKIAIPSKTLLETLKALPTQPITISVDDKFGVQITSSYGSYKLAGENGEEFPMIPEPDSVDTFTIDAVKLADAIGNTLFATSSDEMRRTMTGVLFEIDFNKVIVVATDAHKLVKHTILNVESNVSTSLVIPKRSLQLLKSILPSGGDIQIAFNDKNIFFSHGEISLVSKLLEGAYPKYNAVIPVDTPFTVEINREDLLNSLSRISIYANKSTNQVLLDLSAEKVVIAAKDLDFSNEASESLNCTYNGEEIKIAFNSKFFIEMLNILSSEIVYLKIQNPKSAVLVIPDEMGDDEDVLMLIMPIMFTN